MKGTAKPSWQNAKLVGGLASGPEQRYGLEHRKENQDNIEPGQAMQRIRNYPSKSSIKKRVQYVLWGQIAGKAQKCTYGRPSGRYLA